MIERGRIKFKKKNHYFLNDRNISMTKKKSFYDLICEIVVLNIEINIVLNLGFI